MYTRQVNSNDSNEVNVSLSLSLYIAVDLWKLAERVTRDIRPRIFNASSRHTHIFSHHSVEINSCLNEN